MSLKLKSFDLFHELLQMLEEGLKVSQALVVPFFHPQLQNYFQIGSDVYLQQSLEPEHHFQLSNKLVVFFAVLSCEHLVGGHFSQGGYPSDESVWREVV